MKALNHLTCALAMVLLLAGCGGGGSGSEEPPRVATRDTTIAVDSVSGPALLTQFVSADPRSVREVVFNSAVPAVGTSAPTAITFSGSPAAPRLRAVSDAGEVREAVLEFGSCWFLVTTADPESPPNWVVGNRFLVEPCSFSVDTTGKVTGGDVSGSVTLTLGDSTSAPVPVTYSITDSGSLVIGDQTVGSVTVTVVTGGAN